MQRTRHLLKIGLITLLVLLLATSLHAGPTPESILEEAARASNDDYKDSWAYTETAEESGATWIGRYDPRNSAGARWTLISVDGREPTASEVEDYGVEKEDDDHSESGDNRHGDVSGIVEPSSLELLEETDQFYLYSFVPQDEDDDFMEYIDATVKIVKDGPYIEFIDMSSEKPFKPQFGVKINNFITRLGFKPAAKGGPVVPSYIDIRIKVRALLFINVDESVSVSFSDYEYVGDR